MNILDNILGQKNSDQNDSIVSQLAERFGLNANQAQAVLDQLIPALSAGIAHNTQQNQNTASSLLNLFRPDISSPANGAQPDLLHRPEAKDMGNNILGHIFGSKDVSRQVAQSTQQKTGINAEVIKKMLPFVALFAISALSKRAAAPAGQPTQGFMGQLSSLLGGYQQHSIAGEVLNLLKQRN
jgi:hypothetical protein